MDIAIPLLFEYPVIPGTLRLSQDHPGMDAALLPLSASIVGILGYSDNPRILLGWIYM